MMSLGSRSSSKESEPFGLAGVCLSPAGHHRCVVGSLQSKGPSTTIAGERLTMQLCSFLLLIAPASQAFTIAPRLSSKVWPLSSTTIDTEATPATSTPQETVLSVAEKYKNEFGLFLVDKAAKLEIAQAVEELEAKTTIETIDPEALLGSWDLVCTMSTSTPGIDTNRLLPGPLKEWTDRVSSTANQYVTVQQKIRTDGSNDTVAIDRVDHVISYQPPPVLSEFLEKANVPKPLQSLLRNLDTAASSVSESKLILIHKASLTDELNPKDISLQLQSVVWNVAGNNSTYLDPNGKDITSINLPLSEFLGSGTFTTTYLDDTLRIARGKQGPLEVLRIFTKTPFVPDVMGVEDIPDAEIIEDIIMAEDATDADDDDAVPSDVGEAGP